MKFSQVFFSPLSSFTSSSHGGAHDGSEGNDATHNNDRKSNSDLKANIPSGSSTHWGASFNFINSIVGAGIIGKSTLFFFFFL
jgi:hypothetical protein